MISTVIFDLDGTLADTSRDLIFAANGALEALGAGRPLDPEGDAHTAFRGGIAMLKLGLSRAGLDHDPALGHKHLLALYGERIAGETKLYPGIRECVAALQAKGLKLGICTNKPEGLAEKLMAALDFRAPFGALVGGDTLPVRKPNPEPYDLTLHRLGASRQGSVLIGDTETDRLTAKAAQVPSVLVTFGPDGQDVAKLNPEALLHHFDDLEALIEGLS
jgi:phosphoglycolate phosphatase